MDSDEEDSDTGQGAQQPPAKPTPLLAGKARVRKPSRLATVVTGHLNLPQQRDSAAASASTGAQASSAADDKVATSPGHFQMESDDDRSEADHSATASERAVSTTIPVAMDDEEEFADTAEEGAWAAGDAEPLNSSVLLAQDLDLRAGDMRSMKERLFSTRHEEHPSPSQNTSPFAPSGSTWSRAEASLAAAPSRAAQAADEASTHRRGRRATAVVCCTLLSRVGINVLLLAFLSYSWSHSFYLI